MAKRAALITENVALGGNRGTSKQMSEPDVFFVGKHSLTAVPDTIQLQEIMKLSTLSWVFCKAYRKLVF